MTAKRDDPITTSDLVNACGVTREMLYRWLARKLLSRPMISNSGAVWSRGTLDRARFIVSVMREGSTEEEAIDRARERWRTRPSAPRSPEVVRARSSSGSEQKRTR